jgi:hypothetical protein
MVTLVGLPCFFLRFDPALLLLLALIRISLFSFFLFYFGRLEYVTWTDLAATYAC